MRTALSHLDDGHERVKIQLARLFDIVLFEVFVQSSQVLLGPVRLLGQRFDLLFVQAARDAR